MTLKPFHKPSIAKPADIPFKKFILNILFAVDFKTTSQFLILPFGVTCAPFDFS